ncbi:flagellar basal body L-ring protein FlgH [Altererythrobacter sp. H2]|uniref:flagellar basal body L-ring protein FlgH n=1 Tax=Altererythrobacter sp. H2 TaxID=3108391 RepID=UPI002B4BB0DF|nr:flagellar basal body L-ring protein FlgH [Altererythrobacter sp. H2]WRK95314.1 flagellar basal body L-ring protein FlgH [Altererythrobacter sp. H2]
MIRQSAFLVLLPLLGACGMGGAGPHPGFAPPTPVLVAPPVAANGAIFQAANGYAGLHEGQRARRVGDLVTVVLVESIGTSKSTSAQTAKNGSFGVTPPTAGPLSFLNPEALKAAADSSFKGGGSASQRSTLNGAIAVTIAEVRPNGTALITGERHMSLSQGREWVQFAGIVRLADIDGDNRVLSTQVADARINYSGQGAIQQASKPGWLSRFFNLISPF